MWSESSACVAHDYQKAVYLLCEKQRKKQEKKKNLITFNIFINFHKI